MALGGRPADTSRARWAAPSYGAPASALALPARSPGSESPAHSVLWRARSSSRMSGPSAQPSIPMKRRPALLALALLSLCNLSLAADDADAEFDALHAEATQRAAGCSQILRAISP